MQGVKDLFILAQEGQCKQMVFDGISGVISKTLVNWKMIHYIPRAFRRLQLPGREGQGPGHLVRKDPPLGAAKSLTHREFGQGSLAGAGAPLSGEGTERRIVPAPSRGLFSLPPRPGPLVWVCWGVFTAVPGPQLAPNPGRPGVGGLVSENK